MNSSYYHASKINIFFKLVSIKKNNFFFGYNKKFNKYDVNYINYNMDINENMTLMFYFATIFFILSLLKYTKYVIDMMRCNSIQNMLIIKQKKQTF